MTAALHNEMEKDNRPGWVRGVPSGIEAKMDELIKLLKKEYDDESSDTSNDDDDWDKPVTDYDFKTPQIPADGKHREIGSNGAPIGEGEYIDNRLVKGIEYDVLVHVTKGKLIYKPDCPDDPYDSSDDFKYERLESYGWGLSFRPFGTSERYITSNGLEQFYVVDFEVDEETEDMINIRTLEEFLKEKDLKQLKFLQEMIKMENERS